MGPVVGDKNLLPATEKLFLLSLNSVSDPDTLNPDLDISLNPDILLTDRYLGCRIRIQTKICKKKNFLKSKTRKEEKM